MSVIGIRLANLVLFVTACWLTADVVQEVGASVLIPAPASALTRAETPSPSSQPWSRRQAILDRNLFGAQVIADEAPPELEPEPDEDLQETRLPLKLLGTVSSEDQVVATAAIENTRKRSHEVVKVGNQLVDFPLVTVTRIDRGRVVLQTGTSREELTMDDDLLARAPTPPTPKPRPSRRTASRRTAEVDVRDRLEELAGGAGPLGAAAIFSQARILPKYKDGEMVGIELSQIEADSFYEKVGLKDGDLLTSVNGITIDSPSASRDLLQAFSTAEELVAEVMRPDGSTEEIKVDSAQFTSFIEGRE